MDLVYMAGGMLLTALVLAYTCFSAHLLSCQVYEPWCEHIFFAPPRNRERRVSRIVSTKRSRRKLPTIESENRSP